MADLEIPEFIFCEKKSICPDEKAFLMVLYYWFSIPRISSFAQHLLGLEYTQIFRYIRATIQWIIERCWKYLVDDNLDFFSARFQMYNTAIINRFERMCGTENGNIWSNKFYVALCNFASH